MPEYWIVNPEDETVLTLVLQDGVYDEGRSLRGQDIFESVQLGSLTVAISDIFAAANLQRFVG